MVNYIDKIADAIWRLTDGRNQTICDDMSLYRMYALLCLVQGRATDNEDVHDAWSAWRTATQPDHKSLIPFNQLSPEVQALDCPYRDAIRAVARRRLRQ